MFPNRVMADYIVNSVIENSQGDLPVDGLSANELMEQGNGLTYK